MDMITLNNEQIEKVVAAIKAGDWMVDFDEEYNVTIEEDNDSVTLTGWQYNPATEDDDEVEVNSESIDKVRALMAERGIKYSPLSPEDNLMKAVYGDKYKTEREREAEIEKAVNSVSDEDFKKMCGCTIQESTHKSMLWVGWLEAVMAWQRKHGNDRKYHVFKDKNTFTTKQVVDIAQMAYRQGREDNANGNDEYYRLWTINKQNNE